MILPHRPCGTEAYGLQECAFQCGIQKKCHKNKRDDEGISQGAHHPHYQTLSETDDKHQPEDREQWPPATGEGSLHRQLVGDKALRGVGDSHRAANQNGIDGEEIDDGKYFPASAPKMLANNIGNTARRRGK